MSKAIKKLTKLKYRAHLTGAMMLCAPLVTATCFSPITSAHAETKGEMAGVSAAVTGNIVMAKFSGEVGIIVESGMPVHLGDRITTADSSGMQILLLDETVFTIGPNSDIAIDEYVYDPETGKGRIVTDMARGVMRFVTGKIPLKNPSSMDINLPVGSIGIRGTIGLIRSMTAQEANQIIPGSFDTSAPGSADQLVFMAVNQGPGLQRSDTTSRPGAFAAFAQNGGSQSISGENFGVFVSDNTVTPPTRFPNNAATFDFSANLVRTATRDNDGSGNGSTTATRTDANRPLTQQQTSQAKNQTGENSAEAQTVVFAQVAAKRDSANATETTAMLNNVETLPASESESAGDDGNNDGDTVISDDPVSNGETEPTEPTAPTAPVQSPDPVAPIQLPDEELTPTAPPKQDQAYTFDALRTITSGTATTGTIEVTGKSISYNFMTEVDYGDRRVTSQFSNINDGNIVNGSALMYGESYSDMDGPATFDNTSFMYSSDCNRANCNPSVTFTDATHLDFNVTTDAAPDGAASSATLPATARKDEHASGS
ncbi:FecR domain-containing protein [Thalassospira sp. MA62]|nr:FecR domain-containing protein [Thalassospira sp. MA62]